MCSNFTTSLKKFYTCPMFISSFSLATSDFIGSEHFTTRDEAKAILFIFWRVTWNLKQREQNQYQVTDESGYHASTIMIYWHMLICNSRYIHYCQKIPLTCCKIYLISDLMYQPVALGLQPRIPGGSSFANIQLPSPWIYGSINNVNFYLGVWVWNCSLLFPYLCTILILSVETYQLF